MMPSYPPRYERIFSLVLLILTGLAIILFIDTNPHILRARLPGDLPTITVSWLLIALLAVITSAGADLLARSHPEMQTRTLPIVRLGSMQTELAPGFWILPSLSIIGSFAFFRLFSANLHGIAFVLALLSAAGLLLAVLISQHYALDRNTERSQRARLALAIIAYLLAFGCFSAIYFARLRTLYAALLIGSAGALLAYAVLQWTPHRRMGLLAALVGVILAEALWPLNYWPAHFLPGGALLLGILYISVSLLQHHAAGTFHRHVLIEYGVLGGGLLAALMYATIWFSPH
jgi:hypothetical protein